MRSPNVFRHLIVDFHQVVNWLGMISQAADQNAGGLDAMAAIPSVDHCEAGPRVG